MKPLKTVSIVGVGLIGGAIGMALRERKLAEQVIGIGRRQESLRAARRVGAVDHTTVDMEKGVAEADFIIVCTPVGRIVEDVRKAAMYCPEGTLISDAGSTKQTIVAALDDGLPRGCRYLGSHPLAGSEKAGPGFARADLYEGRIAILTPTVNTRAEDYVFLEEFWEALGSVVVRLSPDEHDRALAVTSHLPHLVSAALAATVQEKFFRLAGPGFLDATRIASGDGELWAQIFEHNRENILNVLSQFSANLLALQMAVHDGNHDEIVRLLTLAKKNRDALGS
jgi:cyclohexadieny/prephenate dehydrogenase